MGQAVLTDEMSSTSPVNQLPGCIFIIDSPETAQYPQPRPNPYNHMRKQPSHIKRPIQSNRPIIQFMENSPQLKHKHHASKPALPRTLQNNAIQISKEDFFQSIRGISPLLDNQFFVVDIRVLKVKNTTPLVDGKLGDCNDPIGRTVCAGTVLNGDFGYSLDDAQVFGVAFVPVWAWRPRTLWGQDNGDSWRGGFWEDVCDFTWSGECGRVFCFCARHFCDLELGIVVDCLLYVIMGAECVLRPRSAWMINEDVVY